MQQKDQAEFSQVMHSLVYSHPSWNRQWHSQCILSQHPWFWGARKAHCRQWTSTEWTTAHQNHLQRGRERSVCYDAGSSYIMMPFIHRGILTKDIEDSRPATIEAIITQESWCGHGQHIANLSTWNHKQGYRMLTTAPYMWGLQLWANELLIKV